MYINNYKNNEYIEYIFIAIHIRAGIKLHLSQLRDYIKTHAKHKCSYMYISRDLTSIILDSVWSAKLNKSLLTFILSELCLVPANARIYAVFVMTNVNFRKCMGPALDVLTHWGRVTHICVNTTYQHCFR